MIMKIVVFHLISPCLLILMVLLLIKTPVLPQIIFSHTLDVDLRFILTTGSGGGCNSYVINLLALDLGDRGCAATCLNTPHSALLGGYSFSPASPWMRRRLTHGFGV